MDATEELVERTDSACEQDVATATVPHLEGAYAQEVEGLPGVGVSVVVYKSGGLSLH